MVFINTMDGLYKNQFFVPFRLLAKRANLTSERALADQSGLSRSGVRALLQKKNETAEVRSLLQLSNHLNRSLCVLAVTEDANMAASTIAVSYEVLKNGFDSWKIHFFDFVDEYRRTLDARLFLLEPSKLLDLRLRALLASIVQELCTESDVECPTWASQSYFLKDPWFVAGIESLKATALAESSFSFRRNNIFVLSNFLMRA